MGLLKLLLEVFEQGFLLQDMGRVSPLTGCETARDSGTIQGNFIGVECEAGCKEGRLEHLNLLFNRS